MKIGITGGIGSGKSFVCKLLEQHYGIAVYDCDTAAKRLMRNSEQLRKELSCLIGPDCYLSDGQLNKQAVARFLLASDEHAHAIDAIVHPAVFRDFQESGYSWMESAILFESGINRLVNQVVVVTAPVEVRLSRVMQRDGIGRQKALEWMQRQWPQEQVRSKAHYEILNDGITPVLPQIEKLINTINQINEK